MKFIKLDIEGLILIKPGVQETEDGKFFNFYNQDTFYSEGITSHFVEDYELSTEYGDVHGMYQQTGANAQAKLVRVTNGRVLYVVVDTRKGSTTFGKFFTILLTDDNYKLLYIPQGFAHGTAALSKNATIHIRCDNESSTDSLIGFRYDDPAVNINWLLPPDKVVVSVEDSKLPSFEDFKDKL